MTFEYDLYESKEEGKAEAKLEMIDAMIANLSSKFMIACYIPCNPLVTIP